MLNMTSSLISPAGAPPVVSTSWSLSKDTQANIGTGYKSFTIQITWDPSIAKLDPASIQAISKTSNGDIFQYDTKSIDGGVLRIVGFSSTLQNFANSLTLPVVNFNYSQTTLAPVNFFVNVEQFNGISYKNLATGDAYSVKLGTSTASQVLPAIASTVPAINDVLASMTSPIIVTFNEAVMPGTGSMELHKDNSTGALIQSYLMGLSPTVSVLNKTLTVQP